MIDLDVMKVCAMTLTAIGLGTWATSIASHEARGPNVLGRRGQRRAQALRSPGLFVLVEPVVRWMSPWMAKLPLRGPRAHAERYLQQAGDVLGLTADELFALGLITASLTACLGFVLGLALGAPIEGSTIGWLSGPAWLALSLYGRRQRRFIEVDRALPAIIDLAALCLDAGMDLPGALQLVVSEGPSRNGVLTQELQAVLRALSLGATRTHAFHGLAERLPTASVHDVVAAVVQAEAKGTPLSEALKIQAGVLRGRRSVLAEEAAARAGVWMMLPLLLLLGSTMLITMGGMVIRGMESSP